MIGLSLKEFWLLTPKQFNKYMLAYNDKTKEEIQRMDYLNFMLAKYVAFAFNDVKHFPKKPFLFEETHEMPKQMTDDDMERIAKWNVIKLGGEVK